MTWVTGLLLLLFSSSAVSDSFATPLTVARQAPLSMGFPRQEYWSGLPFPSPGESSQPRDRTHVSCVGRRVLYHRATWETLLGSRHRDSDSADLG